MTSPGQRPDMERREQAPGSAPMFQISHAPIMITGGSFAHVTNVQAPDDPRQVMEKYFKDYIAPNATHDTNEVVSPPRCHPGTRTAILQKLVDWSRKLDDASLIAWIFGPAGVGKSAIARSLAELLWKEGRCAASFFFFKTADKRNNEKFLISTLAYQLAFSIPELQLFIANAVKENPLVFQHSLETQMEKLIIEPVYLSSSPGPQRVIIIDGLDECQDRDAQRLILKIISGAAPRLSGKFKFLVLSRPEHDIESTFHLPVLDAITLSIDLKQDLGAYEDIRTFLKDSFDEIKMSHPLKSKIEPTWPDDQIIYDLVRKSSGNFIYPRTVMKYINTSYDRPQNRLRVILGLSPSSDSPFSELDDLYRHILSSARTDRASLLRLLHVLVACSTSSAPEYVQSTELIEAILLMEPGDVELQLNDLRSLITTEEDPNYDGPLFPRFLHASFPDFLLDSSRSQEFWIDLKDTYMYIAISTLKFFEKKISTIHSAKCDCKLKFPVYFCHHSCLPYYEALFWSCEFIPPNDELELAMRNHDIGRLLSTLLRSDIDDEQWADIGVTLTYFLHRLETSQAFKDTDIFCHNLSKFDVFVKALLDEYHVDENDLLVVCLTLISSVRNFNFRTDTSIFLCVANICLLPQLEGTVELRELLNWADTIADDPAKGRAIALLKVAALAAKSINMEGSQPLKFLAKVVASLIWKAKYMDIKEIKFLDNEAHYPFNARVNTGSWSIAGEYLAQFLRSPDRSGRNYMSDDKLHRVIVYCWVYLSAQPSNHPTSPSMDNPGLRDELALLFIPTVLRLLALLIYQPLRHEVTENFNIHLPRPEAIQNATKLALEVDLEFGSVLPVMQLQTQKHSRVIRDFMSACRSICQLKRPIEANPDTPCLLIPADDDDNPSGWVIKPLKDLELPGYILDEPRKQEKENAGCRIC